MAESTRFHLLPEHNRPSMETLAGDDERDFLLDPLGDDSIPPQKGTKGIRFSYHPTVIIRLVVLCLFISALVMFLISQRPQSIAAIIFLFLAIFRNIHVLTQHVLSRWIRIHIEIIGSTPRPSKPKTRCPSWLTRLRVQVAIDLILVVLLTVTSIIAKEAGFQYWNPRPYLLLPSCILCWIALPGYALSALDMGKPGRITVGASVSFDTSNESGGDEAAPPQVYRDVEASGGLGGKTRSESPTII